MNSAEQIRLVIVDEHALVRDGLRSLLRGAGEIHVVADTADAVDGVAQVRATQAQVMLMNRAAAREDPATVAQLISSAMIHTNLLVLTMLTAPAALESLLMAGVRGYLARSASAEALVDAVRTVARGSLYRGLSVVPLRETRDGVTAGPPDADRQRFERLTERERAVLVSMAQGFSAPEIGMQLQISAKTVDTYKQRIHKKLGLHRRADYVRLALKLRLMESG